MKRKKLFLFLALTAFILIIINVFYFGIILSSSQEIIESNIQNKTYIALYVGDIDGDISEDWFFFYEKLVNFYDKNKIPVTFSFYPGSIGDDEYFNEILKKMYESEYIELMQKGDNGGDLEQHMDNLSKEDQRRIIKTGQDHFKEKMQEMFDKNEIHFPISYNQIGARLTNDTRDMLKELGFKFYFDVYVGDYLNPVTSTDNFYVLQYGIPFTVTGEAGGEHEFKTPQEIFYEINNFSREDLDVLEINGVQVIPLWAHQQDFESQTKENKLNKEKWNNYTQIVKALNNDSNVILVNPSMIYEMMV